MLNIGNLKIEHPLILAPMAGITDHPYRIICKKMGAGLVFTEFVSADGIIRENQKTLDMIKFTEEERPIGVQIFGDKPKIVAQSAAYIYKNFKPDLIDINFGCPVPKVTKKGAGSAALKDLPLMKEITSAVLENVKKIPVTVKMRSGWSSNQHVFLEAANILENIGVAAITLHPRTTSQKFQGKADWSLIKIMKENSSIPIIGNGDVKNIDDYIRMREETNCDAVMIGRGALGNPWIFKQISNYNNNQKIMNVNLNDVLDTCINHYNLLKENKEERVCVNLTKKHFSWYLKGFKNASDWRKKILFSKDINEIEDGIKSMREMSDS